MKQIKVRGLVLREYEAGESDKRLIVFCKGEGRLAVYARGARKPSSKFMACAQLFTYGDFVLTQGQGFYSLSQGQIIENFFSLREDYDRLMAAHTVAEACEKALWDNLEGDELLLLALKSLSALAKEKDPKQVTVVFMLRFFQVMGLCPKMDACVMCGMDYHKPCHCEEGFNQTEQSRNDSTSSMVFTAEGLVCEAHKPASYRRISKDTITAIRYVLDSDLIKSFQFTATDDILKELNQAANFLWNSHFDKELKSNAYKTD